MIAIPAAQLLSRHDPPAQTVRLPGRTRPLNAFHRSADGQRILVAWENAIVLDTRDGKITPVVPGSAIAEWAATGSAVLYFTVEGRSLGGFYRQPLDGAPAVELASRERVAGLEWTSDGTALAAVAILPEGAALQVLDLQTGLWRSPLPGPILQADELPVLGYVRVLSWGKAEIDAYQ